MIHALAARARHSSTPSSFVEENFRDADSSVRRACPGSRQGVVTEGAGVPDSADRARSVPSCRARVGPCATRPAWADSVAARHRGTCGGIEARRSERSRVAVGGSAPWPRRRRSRRRAPSGRRALADLRRQPLAGLAEQGDGAVDQLRRSSAGPGRRPRSRACRARPAPARRRSARRSPARPRPWRGPSRRMRASSASIVSGSVIVFGVAAGIPVRASSSRTASSGSWDSSALPTPGAVRGDPAAGLGEHPHRVPGGHLADVHHGVVVEDGEVRGLAQGVDQAGEHRLRPRAEHRAGDLAERDEPGAERVAAVRQLAHVAALDQRAHQPVDRGQRQAGPRGSSLRPISPPASPTISSRSSTRPTDCTPPFLAGSAIGPPGRSDETFAWRKQHTDIRR